MFVDYVLGMIIIVIVMMDTSIFSFVLKHLIYLVYFKFCI